MTLEAAEAEGARLVRRASSAGAAAAVLPALEDLSERFPNSVGLSLGVLIALEKRGAKDGLTDRFVALAGAAPDNPRVARFAARHLLKARRKDEALAIVERATPLKVESSASAFRDRAELAHDAGLVKEANAIFEEGLGKHPEAADLHASYAKRLRNVGRFREALATMRRVEHRLKPDTAKWSLLVELARLVDALGETSEHTDERIDVMLALVRLYGRDRKEPLKGPGKICFITGSLAVAGAERQLSRLAIVLSDLWDSGRRTGELGEVDVLVRSLTHSLGHDFFLPELQEANVRTEQIEPGQKRSAQKSSDVSDIVGSSESERTLHANAPSLVKWGVKELFPVLHGRNYRTVSLWQDGAALFGAIAALMAGAPRIQLVFRGLPPNERTYLLKPEYEPLYRELAKLPGVDFMANSAIAARGYERWIGLDVGRIGVLPNGIVPPNASGTEADDEMWSAFSSRTGPGPIVGKVGRLDTVKRPLDWIRCAAAVAEHRPDARFVLVGDGRLRSACEDEAARLGIAERTLFVGHSKSVGYWLRHMDVLLMTSRFEGLPNVLIEAQSMGTAVVSTPAGGAEECFVLEETGKLVSCLETVDPDEIAEAVLDVLSWPEGRGYRPEQAQLFAEERYSICASLRQFLRLCGLDDADCAGLLDERVAA